MTRQFLLCCSLATLVSFPWPLSPSPSELSVNEDLQPPGNMFDVGGYRLHIVCKGQGLPTIVFDSGAGGFSLEWTRVQNALARQTQVCAYDRAGYGWSDMGPLPRTSKRIAAELHTLLKNAHVPGPYIIVGHSFGGYTAQYFARHFPKDTAGIVLIDSSHPEQIERLPQPKTEPNKRQSSRSRSYLMMYPIMHENFPDKVVDVAYRLMTSWKHKLTWREEMMSFPISAHEVLHSDPMPIIPVVVLTRGQRVWPRNDYGDEMEKIWMELQDELSQLSRNPVHLIAEKSGHSIHLDQPGIVITALQTVLNAYIPKVYMMGG